MSKPNRYLELIWSGAQRLRSETVLCISRSQLIPNEVYVVLVRRLTWIKCQFALALSVNQPPWLFYTFSPTYSNFSRNVLFEPPQGKISVKTGHFSFKPDRNQVLVIASCWKLQYQKVRKLFRRTFSTILESGSCRRVQRKRCSPRPSLRLPSLTSEWWSLRSPQPEKVITS